MSLFVLSMVVLPACVMLDKGAVFTESLVVRAYVDWLEAERRRDLDLAREVLHFNKGADEDRLEEEFAALAGIPGGTIRTEAEIHLVGHPADWGPGEYLFLVPDGTRYIPARATVVGRAGRALIVYEPPVLTVEERKNLSTADQARMNQKARIGFLKGLDDSRLVDEIEKVRQTLRYQMEAKAYAVRKSLPLAPFSADPEALLAELSGLDTEAARDWLLARLAGSHTAAGD
jgi:hypothetical protein